MASKFAQELLEKIDQGDGMLTTLEIPEYEDLIDAELQEVRDVLADCIAAFPESAEGEQRARAAQRARALMEKLRT